MMPARFRPLLVLVATLLMAALTARLGFWQLDRAEQKLALQAARDAAAALPPLPSLEGRGIEFRRARIEGRWRPELQRWLGNRPLDKQAGFVLVTPLQLPDGGLLWVQRGWQVRAGNAWQAPAWPPTPAGAVLVEGRVQAQASQAYALGHDSADGAVRQNLDLSTPPEPGARVLPWVVWQTEACAPLRCNWPAPATGVDKHHGYAAQWFALCLLTLALYVWFQLLAPWRRARAAD